MACLPSDKTRQKPRASEVTTSRPSMQKSSFETKGSHLHGEPKRALCRICRSSGSILHMALRGNIRTRAAAHGQNQEGNEEEATSDLGRMESGFATGPSDPVGVFGSCCQARLQRSPFTAPIPHAESERRYVQ